MASARPTQLIGVSIDRMTEMDLEQYEIFTPDDEYLTPPTAIFATPAAVLSYSAHSYRFRTLQERNRDRRTILPVFPPCSAFRMRASSTSSEDDHDGQRLYFLLCNIPESSLSLEQQRRREKNAYIPFFDLRISDETRKSKTLSFMVNFHEELYLRLSQKWQVDIPILDCNLFRMQQIAKRCDLHFSIDDLPIALEFFLQVDVDRFHLKTCDFGHSQPVVGGLFATDEQSIAGRYGLTPCRKSHCLCCANPALTVPFDPQQVHRFLNQYEAVLNAPVTCSSSNVVYALTCPCGQKDYVGYTTQPFIKCLAEHYREVARSIREFLYGNDNVNYIDAFPKSEERKINDENWLYQHAARCPAIIQIFLDHNPSYWCFVPLDINPTLRATESVTSPHNLAVRDRNPTTGSIATRPSIRRHPTIVKHIIDHIPEPLGCFVFTPQQVHDQSQFFQFGKDREPANLHTLHFFRASIVAVLPGRCSDTLAKFVHSLFISHAECQLNSTGRLINDHLFHSDLTRGLWYQDLVQRLPPAAFYK